MTQQNLVERRIRYLIAIVLVLLLAFAVRLIDVQAVNAKGYATRATNELTESTILLAPRGAITDVNGVEYARSVVSYKVFLDQLIITDAKTLARLAAPILGMDAKALESTMMGTRRYVLVAQSVKPAIWRELIKTISDYNVGLSAGKAALSKKLAGFHAERIYTRDYPLGTQAASLLGFVNQEGVGGAGLEYSLNSILTGVNGKYRYADGGGTIIPGSQEVIREVVAGQSIRLTIESDIQWVAEEAIAKVVKDSRALSGTVIVMDPKTGAVLAHASFPTFDPSQTKGVDLNHFRNRSVQDVYEPGSIGKVITMAAAIEEGKITPESVLTIPYKLKRSTKTFSDHKFHPTLRLTATGALAISTNTGAIQVGEMLSNNVFHSYLQKFGVGIKTGSKLLGEAQGKLLDVKDWSGTSAPTFSLGQGYSVTAMQATLIFATIANDGVRVSPTVVAGFSDNSGYFTANTDRISVRVISAATATQLRLMMESVVSPLGSAKSAAIPGYRVAGKTGTAERFDDACACYSGYTASFIGFAPADKPRYVVSVTIQDPKGLHWGGSLAGPVFKKVMSFVLESKHVPPTGKLVETYALDEAELKAKVKG